MKILGLSNISLHYERDWSVEILHWIIQNLKNAQEDIRKNLNKINQSK